MIIAAITAAASKGTNRLLPNVIRFSARCYLLNPPAESDYQRLVSNTHNRVDRCFRDVHTTISHAVGGINGLPVAGRYYLGLGL